MRNRVVELARSYIGTPFRHQGRTRHGLDCVGLLVLIAKELDLPCYDEPNYQRRTNGLEFIRKFREAGVIQKNLINRIGGDVVVIQELRLACHVAIYTDEGTMIHSYASRRKVVEEHYTDFWINKTFGCYSLIGVD